MAKNLLFLISAKGKSADQVAKEANAAMKKFTRVTKRTAAKPKRKAA